jgi:hypothetical protein
MILTLALYINKNNQRLLAALNIDLSLIIYPLKC